MVDIKLMMLCPIVIIIIINFCLIECLVVPSFALMTYPFLLKGFVGSTKSLTTGTQAKVAFH